MQNINNEKKVLEILGKLGRQSIINYLKQEDYNIEDYIEYLHFPGLVANFLRNRDDMVDEIEKNIAYNADFALFVLNISKELLKNKHYRHDVKNIVNSIKKITKIHSELINTKTFEQLKALKVFYI
jgi:hypothetical protein